MALDRIAGVRMAAAERRSLPLVIERRVGWRRGRVDQHLPRAGGGSTALITYWLGERFQRPGADARGGARRAAPRPSAAWTWPACARRCRPDNAASLAVVRLLGMAPLGEGRIWCPARGRDEACLWFVIDRQAATPVQREARAIHAGP